MSKLTDAAKSIAANVKQANQAAKSGDNARLGQAMNRDWTKPAK